MRRNPLQRCSEYFLTIRCGDSVPLAYVFSELHITYLMLRSLMHLRCGHFDKLSGQVLSSSTGH